MTQEELQKLWDNASPASTEETQTDAISQEELAKLWDNAQPVDTTTMTDTILEPTSITPDGYPSYTQESFDKSSTLSIFKNTYDSKVKAIDTGYSAKLKLIDELGLDEEQLKVAKANLEAKYASKKEENEVSFMDKIKKGIETFGKAQTDYGMAGQITPEVMKQNEQVLRGMAKLPLGLGKMAEFGYNQLPFEDAKLFSNLVKENESAIKQYALDNGLSEKDISPSDVGKFFVETMPFTKVAGIIKSSIAFGFKSGVAEYGSDKTGIESASTGAENALISAIGLKVGKEFITAIANPMAAIKGISGKTTDDRVLSYVIGRTGETEKEINNIYSSYATGIQKDVSELTSADKTMALLNNTKAGSRIKLDAEYYQKGGLPKLNELEEAARDMFKDTPTKDTFANTAGRLKYYLEGSSSLYSDAKDTLTKYIKGKTVFDEKVISNIEKRLNLGIRTESDTALVNTILSDLRNPEGLDIEQLLALKSKLNDSSASGSKAFKEGTVGDYLDAQIKKKIGDDAYVVWKDVEKRYASKKLLEGFNKNKDKPHSKGYNDFAISLLKWNDREIETSVLAKQILNADETGYKYFNQLKDAVGPEAMADFEKNIVKELISDKSISFKDAISNIKDFGFSTVEGNSIKTHLLNLEGMLPEIDARSLLSQVYTRSNKMAVLTDSLLARVKYNIMGRAWEAIQKRLPSGSDERALSTIGDILKDQKFQQELKIGSDKTYQEALAAEKKKLIDSVKNMESSMKYESRRAKRKKIEENTIMINNINIIQNALKNNPKLLTNRPYTEGAFTVGSKGTVVKGGVPEDVSQAEKIKSAVETRGRGGNVYNPRGSYQDVQVPKKDRIVNTEIVQEQTNQLPNLNIKTPTKDMIDAEIISYGNTPKKLSPEQSTRWNDIVNNEIAPIKAEIKSYENAIKGVSKQNTTKAKKIQMSKDYAYKIKELRSKLKQSELKLPKVK